MAIDIFGDQELNVDGSGHGNLEKFDATTSNAVVVKDDVVVHQGDSTKLEPRSCANSRAVAIRFFSVDGGHTEEIVFSDMELAEATLADGGVVIADDVFNEQWPGVSVGTLRYLEDGAKLAPFLIGFNKVYFTQPEYCDWLPRPRGGVGCPAASCGWARFVGVRRPRGRPGAPQTRTRTSCGAAKQCVDVSPRVPRDGAWSADGVE